MNANPREFYEKGNKRFFAAELRADGTFGAKEYHEGIMEISIEWSSETTNISADDNPRYVQLNAPLLGEGSVKFASLPLHIYTKFFDTRIDGNGAVVVKSRAKAKEVAFGFSTTHGDGTESMYTLYCAVFKIPALETTSFDGQAIRDITLNVNVYPYEVKDAGGKVVDTISYSLLNSREANWDAAQDSIYIPDADL